MLLGGSGWGTMTIPHLQNPAPFLGRTLACSSPRDSTPAAALGLPSKHRGKIKSGVQLAPARGSVGWDLARARLKRLQSCPPVGSTISGDAMTSSTEKTYRDHGPQIVVSQVAMLHSISSQSTCIFSETKGFVQHHVTE